MNAKISTIAILVTVFIVEAILSLYTGLPYDMQVWFQTGNWMNQGINIYLPNDHLGYPPLWAIWCLISYKAYIFFGNNIEAWRLIIKLPSILAHLFLAYSVGRFITRQFNKQLGQRLFFIILSWTFIIYISSMWGQINTISALLTFLAFEASINNKTIKSSMLLGLAIALKIYPLILMPAFLAYTKMKKGNNHTIKFAILGGAIPIIITLVFFAFYQWDFLYFLKTIFYWTPVFETNQPQIKGGCMNIWSFAGLFQWDVSTIWYLRLLWVPIVLGGFIFYLLKRPNWEKMDFNLALITMFSLFLVSYGYVTEQSFVDLLPFALLQVLCFRPKNRRFLMLIGLQVVVFAFSIVNYGPFIFEPLVEKFYPSVLPSMQSLAPVEGSILWIIRGIIGLVFTLYTLIFLFVLLRDSENRPSNTRILDNLSSNSYLRLRKTQFGIDRTDDQAIK